jgi:hypothetical protein
MPRRVTNDIMPTPIMNFFMDYLLKTPPPPG